MILIGCVLGPKEANRKAEIDTIFAARKATDSAIELIIVKDFLEAAFSAEERVAKGESVIIAGAIEDLRVPAELISRETVGFGVIEWRESWLARLEKNQIGFIPLASSESAQIPREALYATAVIRSYTRASQALDKAIQKIQFRERRGKSEKLAVSTGYICGRPPYGYKVFQGRLKKNPLQAEAIELVFRMTREGATANACIRKLKEKRAKGYWDRVKIRRILHHAPLYCLGKCVAGKNTVTIPEVAFLPAEWADTHLTKGNP